MQIGCKLGAAALLVLGLAAGCARLDAESPAPPEAQAQPTLIFFFHDY